MDLIVSLFPSLVGIDNIIGSRHGKPDDNSGKNTIDRGVKINREYSCTTSWTHDWQSSGKHLSKCPQDV